LTASRRAVATLLELAKSGYVMSGGQKASDLRASSAIALARIAGKETYEPFKALAEKETAAQGVFGSALARMQVANECNQDVNCYGKKLNDPAWERAEKAAFAIAEFTAAPTASGLRFAMADDTGTTIFSSELPAAGFVDVKGDGTQYRFRDTTGTLAGTNGVFLALVRRNPTQGTVLVRLKARDHEVPGVVNQPEVSVALGFGSDTGSCFGGLAVPCLARGSRVSCKR